MNISEDDLAEHLAGMEAWLAALPCMREDGGCIGISVTRRMCLRCRVLHHVRWMQRGLSGETNSGMFDATRELVCHSTAIFPLSVVEEDYTHALTPDGGVVGTSFERYLDGWADGALRGMRYDSSGEYVQSWRLRDRHSTNTPE